MSRWRMVLMLAAVVVWGVGLAAVPIRAADREGEGRRDGDRVERQEGGRDRAAPEGEREGDNARRDGDEGGGHAEGEGERDHPEEGRRVRGGGDKDAAPEADADAAPRPASERAVRALRKEMTELRAQVIALRREIAELKELLKKND